MLDYPRHEKSLLFINTQQALLIYNVLHSDGRRVWRCCPTTRDSLFSALSLNFMYRPTADSPISLYLLHVSLMHSFLVRMTKEKLCARLSRSGSGSRLQLFAHALFIIALLDSLFDLDSAIQDFREPLKAKKADRLSLEKHQASQKKLSQRFRRKSGGPKQTLRGTSI